MVTEIEKVTRWPDEGFHGRRKIFTNKREINVGNVVEVLQNAIAVHEKNAREISYLYDVYRGIQDVRLKEKIVRPEINNKVVVNRANEIVTFKDSYFLGDPIQYASTGASDEDSEAVNMLNACMASEDKAAKDQEIVNWMHICGVGIRMAMHDDVPEESPVCIYAPDPREAFAIYWSGVSKKKVAGVLIQKDENDETVYCVYTAKKYFEITGDGITAEKARTIPYIPIVEYANNKARMGAFEPVIPLLNAINTLESNRVDGIQDFVNAYDVFQNCEIDKEKYEELAQGGKAIMIRSSQAGDAKVYRITSAMDQAGAQSVVDDMYEAVLTICGMPNRNGGSSTSDTGKATIMRDGWAAAESRAKDTEKMFDKSEREFLKIALHIFRESAMFDLGISSIKIEHPRNDLSNMQSRMQVLSEGLNNEKIHPKIPWILAGIPNAEEYYKMSTEYYDEQQRKLNARLEAELNVRTDGQDNRASSEESDS